MKKPWYKTWWVWVIIVAVLAIIGTMIGNQNATANALSNPSTPSVSDGNTADISSDAETTDLFDTANPSNQPTAKESSSLMSYEVELGSGNYTAGIDFPAGTYNFEAISGGGNVSSDNIFDGGINAIMGTDDLNDTVDMYEPYYFNIKLPEGTVIHISGGVVVSMTSDNASSSPLQSRNQNITDIITLGSGYFVAGEDFPAGIYCIVAVDDGGNVSSDNIFDGGINAIMGASGDGFFEKEYKNISLPEGTKLSIDGVTIQLVPSK